MVFMDVTSNSYTYSCGFHRILNFITIGIDKIDLNIIMNLKLYAFEREHEI